MAEKMLSITDLHVTAGEKEILRGLSIDIWAGEVHALMGPNGSGKSTLTQALIGNQKYSMTGGRIMCAGQNILELKPDERARLGLFISWQHPLELEGVRILTFLKASYDAIMKHRDPEFKPQLMVQFREKVLELMKKLGIEGDLLNRYVNVGFSGGEKKKLEMLQLLLLDPQVAILDEIDSGLDVDALRVISTGINEFRGPDKAVLLITHYNRLLQQVQPDHVHILVDGQIIHSGDKEVPQIVEEKGYEHYKVHA